MGSSFLSVILQFELYELQPILYVIAKLTIYKIPTQSISLHLPGACFATKPLYFHLVNLFMYFFIL